MNSKNFTSAKIKNNIPITRKLLIPGKKIFIHLQEWTPDTGMILTSSCFLNNI